MCVCVCVGFLRSERENNSQGMCSGNSGLYSKAGAMLISEKI